MVYLSFNSFSSLPTGVYVIKRSTFSKPYLWCFTTYFTEGLPFAIVRMMSTVFFTDIGMKERYLGYLNFLGIPWNLKFLWAPVVDIFGSKRVWMIAVQTVVIALTAAVAGLCFASANITDPRLSTSILLYLFIVMAFVAATNDIVIDGYYMEGLQDPKEQAAFTGYRVFAYRLSLVLAKFGIIFAVGALAKKIPNCSIYTAWGYGFAAAAGIMAMFTLYHLVALPDFAGAKKSITSLQKAASDFIASFALYLELSEQRASFALKSSGIGFALVFSVYFYIKHDPIQAMAFGLIGLLVALLVQAHKTVALSLLFIIFYKIGDEIIFSMGTPFLKRYLLVSNIQLAWMTGLLGLIGSIVGTTIGGLWIKKTGLKKAIWPLTLFMNLNIAAYICLAWQHPLATTTSGLFTIGAVYCYEQFAAGLGNAALIVYILHTCKKEFKAGHYAIGSAFMSIFSTVFGGFGGIIVEKTGYLNLFVVGFLATIPAMLLMLIVPIRDD
jgi:MFS transporter, PAT family, beta-lactamase induction signal transducer AmpG